MVVEDAVKYDKALKAFHPPSFNRYSPMPFSCIFPQNPSFSSSAFSLSLSMPPLLHKKLKKKHPTKNYAIKIKLPVNLFSRNCRKTTQVHNKRDSKSLSLRPKRPTKEWIECDEETWILWELNSAKLSWLQIFWDSFLLAEKLNLAEMNFVLLLTIITNTNIMSFKIQVSTLCRKIDFQPRTYIRTPSSI